MQTLWNDEQLRPVQHLRAVDLSVMVPGPYVTRLLAQYGADVIKIENLPVGDPLREAKHTDIFTVLNQGKRSVALNLKNEDGIQVVKRLVAESDLFVENFREGVMDRLGLGYAELSEENPDLLYVSIRGFVGNEGQRAGHDINFVATSGCGEWLLESGANSSSTQFADIVGGALVPAIKLLVHLTNPDRGGMHLITHMDESFRSLYLLRAFDSFRAAELHGEEKKQFGIHRSLGGALPCFRYYRCRDGQWISLGAIQEKHWETFCDVIDRAGWKKRKQDTSLVPEVEKLFLDAPASYWEALASKKEVCLFRVVPWEEHLTYSSARSQLATDPLNWCGFSPNPQLRPAPALGADSYSTLHTLGISNQEIAKYIDAGIVLQSETK